MFNPPAPFDEGEAPEALADVLLKGLEKDPARRFRSCSEMSAALEKVRRVRDSTSLRVAHAALERYRQILALVDEHRALGHRLRIADVDEVCDDAAEKLSKRFPAFARQASADSLIEPMDASVAAAALTALQSRYAAELAVVTGLREEAADSLARTSAAEVDLTLQRRPPGTSAPPATGTGAGGGGSSGGSLLERAAALFHKLKADRGQSPN
jgi:hypothetical protein